MWDICKGDINNVDGKTSFDAMRNSDFAGKMVVEKYCNFVAIGIANVINIFQPEIV